MINRLQAKYPAFEYFFSACIVVLVSFMYATALNFFLIPGHIYSGGVMGFSQLIIYYLNHYTPYAGAISPGNLNFILNIPIVILSFIKLGKRFTILTLMIVAGISLASDILPVTEVSNNPLLNGVIGGVIAGSSLGIAVKYGMSAGGTDIISMVVFRQTGINVGSISLLINSLIIVGAGIFYTWEFALYTLISMYVSARMVNTIHTNEHRLTAFIVTDRVDEVVSSIYRRMRRGITVLDGHGGYSKEPRYTLMVVINRYEMYDLEAAIHEADDHAFVNIIHSTKVFGNFLSKQQQDKYKNELKINQERAAEKARRKAHKQDRRLV